VVLEAGAEVVTSAVVVVDAPGSDAQADSTSVNATIRTGTRDMRVMVK
jgi:hypothetical protein